MNENKMIEVSIISVLLYLVFNKIFNIFVELLFWAYIKLNSDIIDYPFIIVFVIVSLFILNTLYDYFIRVNSFFKALIALLIILIVLIASYLGIKNFVSNAILEEEMTRVDYISLYYKNFKYFDIILPFLALILFLWKRGRTNMLPPLSED